MLYGDKRQEGCVIHIGVGLMRCSFLTYRAMRRPLNRGASDSAGLHVFFMSNYVLNKKN
jgi:hypothetical protein